ncbi:MAG: hypothetical protein Q8O31_04795 [Rhodocyclaceae bacterium]|nr:hypothetical protein [Rhodocyclaceae bacterium]
MKSTLLSILAFIALAIAFLATPLFFTSGKPPLPPPSEGLPWQIDMLPEGRSKVFGLTLGEGTLNDAMVKFGHGDHHPQIAIITAPEETGVLEAYWESVSAGFITGKMVLTLEVSKEVIESMRSRSIKTEYMKSTTRQSTLHPDDKRAVLNFPIAAIAFIPAAQLDEERILQRFGTPDERIRGINDTEHFLYPAKGLDLRLDGNGKEVLQYVAPRDFARLRHVLIDSKTVTTP